MCARVAVRQLIAPLSALHPTGTDLYQAYMDVDIVQLLTLLLYIYILYTICSLIYANARRQTNEHRHDASLVDLHR